MRLRNRTHRTIPAGIRSSLLEAAELRHRQLIDLRRTPRDRESAVAAAHRRSVERILREVLDALDRLDDGSFGTCQGCAALIPLERLQRRPWDTHCGGCLQP
ncbi:TraR/DksA family transcriptional regulator [Nocardioides ferulae]|uniref:TraR/DksA family transcriptional regulator n=1 Tax=Nocardioides ferulae TaxID=2340821 RepID=UPI000EB52DEF|nr:molecular chaperone DnaK [Nocardioides ferulae]